MRIVVAHNYYQQSGGEDAVFAAESKLLEQFGHVVIRYTSTNEDVKAYSPLALAGSTLWNRTHYQRMRKLLQEERPDILHVHNTLPLISPSIYYAAHAENVPVVQMLHNYRPFCLNGVLYRDGHICEDCIGRYPIPGVFHKCYRGSMGASSAVIGLYAVHYKMLHTYQRYVSMAIASTQFAKNLFIRMGWDAKKIIVKPNLVNVAEARSSDFSTRLNKKAIFVGRFDDRKGIWTLLSAIERTSIPVVLVGDGNLRSKIEEWLYQRPDLDIELTGWLDINRLSERFVSASMLILPSEFYESFGNVIVEAYSYGIPVVTTNIGAQAELVIQGETGFLFPVGDVNALADILEMLARDPERLDTLGANARKQYEQKYAPDRIYQVLMDVYSKVLRTTT